MIASAPEDVNHQPSKQHEKNHKHDPTQNDYESAISEYRDDCCHVLLLAEENDNGKIDASRTHTHDPSHNETVSYE